MTSEPDAVRGAEEGVAESRRMEAMGRLAAGIAHDFNNVLAAVRGYGQIALRSLDAMTAGGGPDDERIPLERDALARLRADVVAIDESARRAAAITRQLSTLARRPGTDAAPLDLDAFAAGLHDLLRRLVPPTVEVTLSPGAAQATALANEPALLQATLELVLDLRDAIGASGRIALATEADAVAGRVALVLRHSAADVGALTARTRQVVAALVGGGGAQLRDGGSGDARAIVLSLPAAHPGTGQTSAPTGGAASAAMGGATVLLVEDDAAVRRIARTVLERMGHRVVPAGDGGEALRMVEMLASDDVVPDLLVTDVTMPGMSGPELAAELRRRAPGVGVLFMSGMGEPSMTEVSAAGERAEFLEKPFTLDDLAARVAGLLAAS